MNEAPNRRATSRVQSMVGDAVIVAALAMYAVTAGTSFAALVFSGPVSSGLPRGAATFVFAGALATIFVAWRSRFRMVFASVQDTAAIVLLPAAAYLATTSSDDPVGDLFVVLAVSTALTGAAMWIIGRAGLAGAVRFVPTTVVAGFLAGTGWLLAKGGMEVMVGQSIGLGDIDDLLSFDLAKFWLPGVALGLFIVIVPFIRGLSPVASSVMTIGMILGFFVIVGLASSVTAVEDAGWMVGPFPSGGNVALVGSELVDADWSAIAGTTSSIGIVAILSILGVLLNLSGIQAFLGTRVDLDAELKTTGIANLLVAPVGGLVVYHAIGDTVLAGRLGARRRSIAITVGLIVMCFAFVGRDLIGYLPRFAAGGLLIGAGVGLLVDWLRELRSTTGWLDRIVSIIILAVIVFIGILEGIVLGLLAACVFFVIRYSRIDPVRVESTGVERRSVVARTGAQREQLAVLGPRLVVYELHGSLFFGSVSGIAERVRARISHDTPPVDAVVVDFGRVTDIDSSAFAVFAELAADADELGIQIVWSGLEPATSAALQRLATASSLYESDLDAALEVAENELLTRHAGSVEPDEESESVPNEERYSRELLAVFTRRRLESGTVLVEQDEPSDELFVVITGRVRVSRVDADGHEVRLRTLQADATIGEIGFLTGEPRTAQVVAEGEVEVLVLDRATHDRLRSEQPELVLELYDRVLQSTADLAAAIHRSLTDALR